MIENAPASGRGAFLVCGSGGLPAPEEGGGGDQGGGEGQPEEDIRQLPEAEKQVIAVLTVHAVRPGAGVHGEEHQAVQTEAEDRCRQLYQVTNEYAEDALARAEEAMQMALDEVKQQRVRFRSASAAKMQEQRAKMNGTDEPESTDE